MTPTSQSWIQQLHGEDGVRDIALTDLGNLLTERLQKAFRSRPDLTTAFLDDIVQETLIKILNSLGSFEGRSAFETWATTIAIHTAYSELRKKKWKDVSLEQVISDGSHTDHLSIDKEGAPNLSSDRRELIDAMYQAIRETLTEKQRTAMMAELNGMPLEEIARRTDSNRNAVYKLTHDARMRMKQSLEKMGYTSEDWFSMK